jgi:hypothetical protein
MLIDTTQQQFERCDEKWIADRIWKFNCENLERRIDYAKDLASAIVKELTRV